MTAPPLSSDARRIIVEDIRTYRAKARKHRKVATYWDLKAQTLEDGLGCDCARPSMVCRDPETTGCRRPK